MAELDENQISAAIDGQADDALQALIDEQPEYARMIDAARQFEQALRQKLFRWDCPSAQQLGDYHFAILPKPEMERIERHVTACVRCRQDLVELTSFLTLPDRETMPAPPRAAERITTPLPGRYLLQPLDVDAALSFRGDDNDALSLNVHAEGVTIFLEANTIGSKLQISGQVVTDDPQQQATWQGAFVAIFKDQTPIQTFFVNPMGEFGGQLDINHVADGAISLHVAREPGYTLVLNGIKLLPDTP